MIRPRPALEAERAHLANLLEAIQRCVYFLEASDRKHQWPLMPENLAELNLPLSRVYGVVTFYSFFTLTPRGKHTVRVCLGTACYVRGGKVIAETLQKELCINEGETTPDRMFTLETIRCLGACGLGPVVVVDEDVHGRVKPSKVKEILSQYR